MIDVSAGYKTKLESQSNQPRIRFLFYKDSITATTIAFHENSPAADTITDSGDGLLAAGLQADDAIIVSGSTLNNGGYIIDTVTDGTITLIATDDLAEEAAGDEMLIIASRTTYDSYVDSVSSLRRDTSLSSGTAVVKVTNIDQTWNIFESDLTNFGKTAQLKLFFSGDSEYITYFTGTVEKVVYKDAFAFLYIRDKMASTLEIPLQSGQYPVEIYDPIGEEVCFNPADLVWKILVDFGGLDDTVGVGNVDIDYDTWVAWHDDCVAGAKNYCLRARFTGHSIRSALLAIANRSNSYIWVNNEDKFSFAPPYDAAGQTFSVSDCKEIDLDISKEGLMNDCIVYYGYQPNVGPSTWTGTQSDDDAGSKTAYGDREFTEESRVVWHWNVSSALSDAVYKILGYKNPIKYILLEATMKGFITEIADEVTVTESLKGLSSETVRIIEIASLDLTEGTVMLKGIMTT